MELFGWLNDKVVVVLVEADCPLLEKSFASKKAVGHIPVIQEEPHLRFPPQIIEGRKCEGDVLPSNVPQPSEQANLPPGSASVGKVDIQSFAGPTCEDGQRSTRINQCSHSPIKIAQAEFNVDGRTKSSFLLTVMVEELLFFSIRKKVIPSDGIYPKPTR